MALNVYTKCFIFCITLKILKFSKRKFYLIKVNQYLYMYIILVKTIFTVHVIYLFYKGTLCYKLQILIVLVNLRYVKKIKIYKYIAKNMRYVLLNYLIISLSYISISYIFLS